MKRIFILLLTLCISAVMLAGVPMPKREFRGAWIQMINGQFQGMSRDQMQANLTHQLDVLQRCHVNTIIFQVRGEADAMYQSSLEPWTRFLSGQQGVAPQPLWDPLAWMVNECHRRGMELHAWINPYRAKTKTTKELAANHPARINPERFISYDNQLIFNPGLKENRDYICTVVKDIVSRYDIDGLHIDDYFYPYPNGTRFDDEATFRQYGNGFTDLGDWRRFNVNLLIEQLYKTIHDTKPWVKFGVSPFGIYHNAKNGGVPGSDTNGLQNYDDLYADVLYWINRGWVDYNVPQIYWEIGHKAADYDTLIRWWSKYASARPLVIGQDVERTVRAADLQNPAQNQMPAKFQLQRTLPGVSGSCLWYSAAVVRNEGNYAGALEQYYHRYPALQPLMPWIDKKTPRKVRHLSIRKAPDGNYLFWEAPKEKHEMNKVRNYVVYRFARGEKVNTEDASHILTITPQNILKLPVADGKTRYTYVVTALNRLQNESKGKKKKY
nr:family 10 glycosylhydrolase [uncultured Alloprevotella sp.]